jgi:hypothetical protein
MPPSSILRSFYELLPDLPYTALPGGGNYRNIRSSSASTDREDPPVSCIQEDVDVLINLVT